MNFEKKKYVFDAILCVILLFISLLLWFVFTSSKKDGSTVVVYVNGTWYASYDLQDDQEVTLELSQGNLVFRIEDGMVYVVSSDCKNHDCMHYGKITQAGESIICLPLKVTIQITGAGEVDAYV